MKAVNGYSKSSVNLRQFWKDFISNENIEAAMVRLKETTVVQYLKILGVIVTSIVLLVSLKWACFTSDAVPVMTSDNKPVLTISKPTTIDDTCPWKLVFSDMANRLQLLEMAFKDQVVARLSIEKEVNNQSYVNLLLDKKLAVFSEKLERMNVKYRHLERKLEEMSSRLYSDESLGFLIILLLIIEIMLRVRPHIETLRSKIKHPEKTDRKSEEKETSQVKNGVNYSPKHGLVLKNELCVIVFKRDNNNIISSFIDVTLKNLDDVKLTNPSHYVIEKHEMLRHIPRARLYLVVTEMEEKSAFSFCRQMDNDIQLSAIRFIKSMGANIILLVTNDETSKKLTAHSLYNTSLRFIQSNDTLQDMASSGKVFSMWRELSSHQLSHLRKNIKTCLHLKIPPR